MSEPDTYEVYAIRYAHNPEGAHHHQFHRRRQP